MNDSLKRTPLYDLHLSLKAKMVPFAGYQMPVNFPEGVLKEHQHTRAAAGLFDVSHMGQITIRARSGTYEDAAAAFETLVPVDALGLEEGRQRYGFLTNDAGGIIDDLMFANRGDHLSVTVNAARKDTDFALLTSKLENCEVTALSDRALIALQGPVAAEVLEQPDMKFLEVADMNIHDIPCTVSRSGYTGEDGFEISVAGDQVEALASQLLAHQDVAPIGLGARDSLRLEAGLCLYGHDITESITPIEASLNWAIGKARRSGGAREGGFPGAKIILDQLENGVTDKRVGIVPDGRAPMREETRLFADETSATRIGVITSGGYSPSVNGPISMGYLPIDLSKQGTTIYGEVRGKRLPAKVTKLPFFQTSYKR